MPFDDASLWVVVFLGVFTLLEMGVFLEVGVIFAEEELRDGAFSLGVLLVVPDFISFSLVDDLP